MWKQNEADELRKKRGGSRRKELERQQLAAGRGPGSASPQHVTEHRWGKRERNRMLFNLLSASKSYSPPLPSLHSLAPSLPGCRAGIFHWFFAHPSASRNAAGYFSLHAQPGERRPGHQRLQGGGGEEVKGHSWPVPLERRLSDCLTRVLSLTNPQK